MIAPIALALLCSTALATVSPTVSDALAKFRLADEYMPLLECLRVQYHSSTYTAKTEMGAQKLAYYAMQSLQEKKCSETDRDDRLRATMMDKLVKQFSAKPKTLGWSGESFIDYLEYILESPQFDQIATVLLNTISQEQYWSSNSLVIALARSKYVNILQLALSKMRNLKFTFNELITILQDTSVRPEAAGLIAAAVPSTSGKVVPFLAFNQANAEVIQRSLPSANLVANALELRSKFESVIKRTRSQPTKTIDEIAQALADLDAIDSDAESCVEYASSNGSDYILKVAAEKSSKMALALYLASKQPTLSGSFVSHFMRNPTELFKKTSTLKGMENLSPFTVSVNSNPFGVEVLSQKSLPSNTSDSFTGAWKALALVSEKQNEIEYPDVDLYIPKHVYLFAVFLRAVLNDKVLLPEHKEANTNFAKKLGYSVNKFAVTKDVKHDPMAMVQYLFGIDGPQDNDHVPDEFRLNFDKGQFKQYSPIEVQKSLDPPNDPATGQSSTPSSGIRVSFSSALCLAVCAALALL